jgi:hypothetical protein
MRSVWFSKKLRWYYWSSALDTGLRVGCPRTFPHSKHLNLSYERAFAAYEAYQEIDVATATQQNIFAVNQDIAEHRKLLCSQSGARTSNNGVAIAYVPTR